MVIYTILRKVFRFCANLFSRTLCLCYFLRFLQLSVSVTVTRFFLNVCLSHKYQATCWAADVRWSEREKGADGRLQSGGQKLLNFIIIIFVLSVVIVIREQVIKQFGRTIKSTFLNIRCKELVPWSRCVYCVGVQEPGDHRPAWTSRWWRKEPMITRTYSSWHQPIAPMHVDCGGTHENSNLTLLKPTCMWI